MNDNNAPIGEEWWTDDQRDLVQDVSSVWIKKKFETVAGIWLSMNGGRILRKLQKGEKIPDGATLDNTAWDHEHCALCWQKISEYTTDQHEGYTDGEKWLRMDCHDKYIK